jgi:hypothetical protein
VRSARFVEVKRLRGGKGRVELPLFAFSPFLLRERWGTGEVKTGENA